MREIVGRHYIEMHNSKLESTRLYAESLYRKLVAIQFDLKQGDDPATDIQLGDILVSATLAFARNTL